MIKKITKIALSVIIFFSTHTVFSMDMDHDYEFEIEQVQKPLKKRKKNKANHSDEEGNTFLHQACRDGNLELVKDLINQGINHIDCRNRYGETPLFKAIKHHPPLFFLICEVLIDAGAQIAAQDNYGNNCMKAIRPITEDVYTSGISPDDLDRIPDFSEFRQALDSLQFQQGLKKPIKHGKKTPRGNRGALPKSKKNKKKKYLGNFLKNRRAD